MVEGHWGGNQKKFSESTPTTAWGKRGSKGEFMKRGKVHSRNWEKGDRQGKQPLALNTGVARGNLAAGCERGRTK